MKKILIVEDNEVIVKGLNYLLTQENFEVKTCGNVNDAKNSISSEMFDLIILDITLPDGNGFELCKYFSLVASPPRMCRSDLFMSKTLRASAAKDGLISISRSATSLCTVDFES